MKMFWQRKRKISVARECTTILVGLGLVRMAFDSFTACSGAAHSLQVVLRLLVWIGFGFILLVLQCVICVGSTWHSEEWL